MCVRLGEESEESRGEKKAGKRGAGLGSSDAAETQAWGGEKGGHEAQERFSPLQLRFVL